MDPDLTNQPFPKPEILPAEPFYDDEDEEELLPTRYRAVNRFAVLSLVFGGLSILTVLGWFLLVIPLLGMYFAYRAWRQIRRLPEEMTGLGIARAGFVLSLVLLLAGGGYLRHVQKTSVPTGYVRVSWEELQPDRNKPSEKVSERAKELDGQRVFIEGFIYPTRKIVGLRRFLVVPTQGHCNFCSRQITPSEIMHVQTAGDMTVDYRNYMVGIGGLLRVQPVEGELAGVIYGLEADVFRD